MIDWDAPDPAPDSTPPQDVVEISTLADALKLLEQWQGAYDDLRREYVRLHHSHAKLQRQAEHAGAAADNLELVNDRLSSDCYERNTRVT